MLLILCLIARNLLNVQYNTDDREGNAGNATAQKKLRDDEQVY